MSTSAAVAMAAASAPGAITTTGGRVPIDLSIPVQKKGEGGMIDVAALEQRRKEQEEKRRQLEESRSSVLSAESSSSVSASSAPPSPVRGAGAEAAAADKKKAQAEPQWAMDSMGFFLCKGEEAQFNQEVHRLDANKYADLARADVAPEERCRLVSSAVESNLDWWRLRARELDNSNGSVTSNTNTNKTKQQQQKQQQPSSAAAAAAAASDVAALAQWRRHMLREVRVRVRRQGISPAERAVAWPLLAGLEYDRSGRVEACMARLLTRPIDPELKDVIMRDLGRTLPTHSLFRGGSSIGQVRLERVLHCYCALDPATGYVQGMGFLVAVLLLHMPEHDAFAVLVQMMHSPRYNMRALFLSGFPLLQRMLELFRRLLRLILPQLAEYFDLIGIDPAFFASHWFLTLFSYQFSVPVVCRIWDLFFAEGWIWIFRVALALLMAEQRKLRELPMEEILMFVKQIHEGKSETDILRMAKDIPVRESDLCALECEEGDPPVGLGARFP